jgi:hypothetical protein
MYTERLSEKNAPTTPIPGHVTLYIQPTGNGAGGRVRHLEDATLVIQLVLDQGLAHEGQGLQCEGLLYADVLDPEI